MAQIHYRANLSSSIFPLTLSRSSGSVIIPGPDQNYDRRVDPRGETSPPGIPQAIYLENVMPSVEGYQSVGYRKAAPMPGPAANYVIMEVKRPDGGWPIVMAFAKGGTRAYFLKDATDGWVEIPVTTPVVFPAEADKYFSTIIRGKILLWIGGNSYEYTYGGADEIVYNNGAYSPAGVLDDVICILSSQNYLILVKDVPQGVAVLWSSNLDPFDFTPSLVTGSGGGTLATTQGSVVSALPCPLGFYVYTKNNTILATYTGNSRYPFKFLPVKDAQGIVSPLEACADIDESSSLIFTRHGQLHLISGDTSALIAPEISEFLERSNTYDIYDKSTGFFSIGRRPVGYRKVRPYIFGSRYICISIKEEADEDTEEFNAVLIYDKLLARYGKLKLNHTKLFTFLEFEGNLITGVKSDRLVLAAVTSDTNEVWRWTFLRDPERMDLSPAINHDAVLVLGRFQYVRSRDICVDEIILEGSEGKASPDTFVQVMRSRNGKIFDAVEAPIYNVETSDTQTLRYYSSLEGRNISIAVRGSFELSNLELTFHPGGSA